MRQRHVGVVGLAAHQEQDVLVDLLAVVLALDLRGPLLLDGTRLAVLGGGRLHRAGEPHRQQHRPRRSHCVPPQLPGLAAAGSCEAFSFLLAFIALVSSETNRSSAATLIRLYSGHTVSLASRSQAS